MDIIRKPNHSHAKLNVPALVLIGAIGIITTRCLDIVLLVNLLGVSGVMEFMHRGMQTPALTAVFSASLLMIVLEFYCAAAIIKGKNWGRWVFLLTQIIAVSYLWLASLGYGYPELFSIPGESKHEIFRSLVVQKLPDLLVLCCLFIPPRARLFFRLH